MRKRLMTAVTAGLVLLGAASAAAADGEIKYLAYPWFAFSDQALAKFTAKTGIKVTQEVLGYEELNTKVTTSSIAGVAPADVFAAYVVPLGGEVAANFVEPLDSCLPDELKNDLNGIDTFRFGGKLMGVPTNYDVTLMLVNTKILQEAGITKIPETLDELRDASLAIKKAGVVKYPLIIPLAAQALTADRWELFSLDYAGGPMFDENNKPLFTDPNSAGAKALHFMVESLGTIVDPVMTEIENKQQEDAFRAGDVAFYFSNLAALKRSNDPSVSKIVGLAKPALIPGTDKVKSAALNFYIDGLAMSKNSQNKDAACQFIQWWLSKDMTQTVSAELKFMPARKSDLAALVASGKVVGADLYTEESKYGLPVFPAGIPPWFDEWETYAASEINQAARGNVTVDVALKAISDKAVELQAK